MKKIVTELNLLHNQNGVIRVPFLIKGRVIAPPEISRDKIEHAFAGLEKDIRYVKLADMQLIREPVIDGKTLKYTGEYLYQVMPPVNARDLIETDINKLVEGPYALSVNDILDYLESLAGVLLGNSELVAEVWEMGRLTAELPEAFGEGWLASIQASIDRDEARQMIDRELSLWEKPGSQFLEGWVEVPAQARPGLVSSYGREIFASKWSGTGSSSRSCIRAMPTRQLHITAGNAPEVPVISTLRAVLTKSAAVIKMPFGATLTGSLMALAAASLPDHPLTQNLSLVYWQGGDTGIENILFSPHAFDRIVVWGSPETVASVQSRALYTRTVYFNPRYGVSLIGREAFQGNLEEVAIKASADSLIYNQKACTSSQVHYLEASGEEADRYAAVLREVLSRWDNAIPQFIPPNVKGQIKRLKRGKYSNVQWSVNTRDDEFQSGVVVMPGEFDILDHPMCRLIVVRPVSGLTDVLKYLHAGVSTVGVYPESRRLSLKDLILARGVSNVLPLGECERMFAGMPQDGLPVLSQLVDWKNS